MKNEEIINCHLCGSSSELKTSDYPGYQEPETFKIYHCRKCNTAFSLPRVETAGIYESIYKNGKLVPGYNRYWNYMNAVKKVRNPLGYIAQVEDIYWSIEQALITLVKEKQSTKVLEIGSGLGYLTYSLINAGYDVLGLDISKEAVKQAINNYGEHYICSDLFDYVDDNEGSFDIVILTEVIEHVDKPLKFIDAILKLLKKNGHAIITTPNKSFFPSEVIWNTESPPIHLWWFSEDSMKYIAEKRKVNLALIDFSAYYQNNYRGYDVKKALENIPVKPRFSKEGGLIDKQNFMSVLFHSIFYNTPLLKKKLTNLKNRLFRLRVLTNPNIVKGNKRGFVLCAIFSLNEKTEDQE